MGTSKKRSIILSPHLRCPLVVMLSFATNNCASSAFIQNGAPLLRSPAMTRVRVASAPHLPNARRGLTQQTNGFVLGNNINDTDDELIKGPVNCNVLTEEEETTSTSISTQVKAANRNMVADGKFNWVKRFVKNPAMWFAMVAVMFSVLFYPLDPAMATGSGGRLGGSFGGSESSRSYSAPAPSRSYGGGGGGGYGYYRRSSPSVIVTPGPYVSPFSSWGWGGGGLWSPFYRPYYSPGVTVVSSGPSVFGFLFTGAVFVILFTTVSGILNSSSNEISSGSSVLGRSVQSALGPGVTVAQISVALEVPRRDDPGSILSYLSRLSRTANTDSRVGLQDLVSQVALQLLRQKRSIFAANSKSNHYSNPERAQREFNTLSIRERSKFERETVSKFGGVDYGFGRDDSSSMTMDDRRVSRATEAVVTLVIQIDGDSTNLPPIRSLGDVDLALSRIASDAKVDNCLRSAEILWTPEERSETLTRRDVLADYPNLRTV